MHAKRKTRSEAFLAETVETGNKYRDVTYGVFKRCRAFPERVGPRILSLESVDYFGTSEHFSGRKKKNFYEQHFSETSMVGLTGRVLQMSLVISMQFF